MPSETLPPLLNQYKYGLVRRRALQTITGGLKLQKAPWYIHVIQLVLWLLPFLLSLPFQGIVFVWNQYYLGIVFAVLPSLTVLLTNGAVWWVLHKAAMRNREEGSERAYHGDEEEEDEIVVSSCWSVQMIEFVFGQGRPLIVIPIHSFISGILCYAGYVLLNPVALLSFLPIPAMLVVFILGWVSVCSAHFSLLAHPPHEIAVHRPPHRDHLQLRFITRPFYVIAIGALVIPIR